MEMERTRVYGFFEPHKDGFNIVVPAIPESCAFGENLEEARAMAEDAIRCYLESAIKNGEAIPKDVDQAY
jgi:antitoxin HicB